MIFVVFFKKFSSAAVIEGSPGSGASQSSLNPASSTALAVVLPKHPMAMSPCLKSGKFLKSDCTPTGLKKMTIS